MSTRGIYGLSGSGIDVESMVKVGMLSKQSQYDKMYKTQTKNEWLKEAYANMYSDITAFTQGTLSDYKLSSKMNPMAATSSSANVATATANADAGLMAHTVDVTKLASNAYLMTGDTGIARNAGATNPKSIALTDIIDTSSWQAGQPDMEIEVSDGKNTATLKLSYEDVVAGKMTLNDLASKMKALSVKNGSVDQTASSTAANSTTTSLNIQASYDATNDAFSLYNKAGGAENKISLTAKDDRSKALLEKLNLHKITSGVDAQGNKTNTMDPNAAYDSQAGSVKATGEDGEVTIDGRKYTTGTNKVSAGNVTYTLASLGKTTVSISQDTDALIKTVKQFVTDYNKMIDGLNEKYNEKQYSNYQPLTSRQEAGMNTTQIDKWNEKAKSGLLYHDKMLGKIISGMREALYTPVEGAGDYNTAMSLGITSSNNQGHIKLDEEKLKKALAADPSSVYKVFGSIDAKDDYKSSGIAQRIYTKNMEGLKTMKSYAGTSAQGADGSTLGNLIMNMKTKMSNFKTLMTSYESNLFKKYDAMEIAISRLSAQSGMIFGGNG